jgi:hypothetical protein
MIEENHSVEDNYKINYSIVFLSPTMLMMALLRIYQAVA